MAGKLTSSLKSLFLELDDRWPKRDHRTDGWYADPRVRKSKGHNPGHNGYSHAIDVDKDGVNPMWIIEHIAKEEGVLWYIIWNRHLYSATYNWRVQPYHGKNPHTDHLHIEVYQTDRAERWQGYWGIAPIPNPGEIPPLPPGTSYGGGGYEGDFGPDYGGRDYRAHITNLGTAWDTAATAVGGYATRMRQLRR